MSDIKNPEKSEIVLYHSEDGSVRIDVTLANETLWLSLEQIAQLFRRDKSTISRHLKNLFSEGELRQNLVVANFATTAADGKTYNVDFYRLEAILAVGYRVKSPAGTQFRKWATSVLESYLVKGFVLNDERFKSGSSMNYFRDLLGRIRTIRISEKVFYQQIKDIYKTSIDYDPTDETTLVFFAQVQNKLLWAVSGKTAAELIYYRSNATLPQMGLTSTQISGKLQKSDIFIGKNYLTQPEIEALKLLVEQFLAYAEAQALAHKPMYMQDWAKKLDQVLALNEKNLLTLAGKISRQLAAEKAELEYKKYETQKSQEEHLESIRTLEHDLRKKSGGWYPRT